jgi:phosphatidate cytidylyltransferase
MNKVLVRIALFFVGLPLLLGLAMWDWMGHLGLSVLAVGISALGAGEVASLLRTKGQLMNPYLPFALGTVFPVLAYLENLKLFTSDVSLAIVALVMVAILIRQIFANTEENLQPVLGKVTGIVFALFYPGFFLYFILKIGSIHLSWLLFPLFILATFGNDAWAWLFGTLFGKRSKKPFLVSPSKSLVGFVGGMAATLLVLVAVFYAAPGLIGNNLFMVVLLSLVLGLTTIAGDLFESSLKRSAGVKDSGAMIPGRGGVLDSIDSLLFSAPVFYLFLQYGRF